MSIQQQCHAWLVERTSPGGPLHFADPQVDMPPPRVMGEITQAVLNRNKDDPNQEGRREGKAAVFTAGPPGVGKSVAISERGLEQAGYRRIDPDVYKDQILKEAQRRGYLKRLSEHVMPDGRPVSPREVAFLVHRESVMVSDRVRRHCLGRSENFIAEGTMSWGGIVDQMEDELVTENSYNGLLIINGEAPREKVQEQARERWWKGRETEDLGGRFVNPSVIDGYYDAAGGMTPTERNAREAYERFTAAGLAVELEVRRMDTQGHRTVERFKAGQPLTSPTPQNAAEGSQDSDTGEAGQKSPPKTVEAGGGGSVPCSVCGQELTSPESIARGTGPTCARKS